MNIPKKLKVGGLHYDVEITNQMHLGAANVSAEIMYDELKIRVAPNPEGRMQEDFLHEMLHAIFHGLGYRDHDEKKIDELAQALYAVIVDNPKMFAEKTTMYTEISEGKSQ